MSVSIATSLRTALLAAGLLVATALPAAAQTVSSQLSSQPDPQITLLSLPSASSSTSNGLVTNSTVYFGTNNSNTITFTGNSGVYSGSVSNVAAAPSTPTGADTASYLLAGGSGATATITYSSSQSSFNLLWGSVDAANTLTFYSAAGAVVGTVTGSQVTASANGAQDATGSYYVSVNGFSSGFTSVVASTPNPAFEFTPGLPTASPAPMRALGATPLSALVLVVGMALLMWRQRRNLQC